MKTADNGRGWQRIYDCTITRGNIGEENRVLARARARVERFFHSCETFRRYDIFAAITISQDIPLLRIAGFVYRRDKKYGKSGGYKKFSGSKNFYSFSTHPHLSSSLPSSSRFAFSFSPPHLRSPMAAITGGNISLLWWISVSRALVYQDITVRFPGYLPLKIENRSLLLTFNNFHPATPSFFYVTKDRYARAPSKDFLYSSLILCAKLHARPAYFNLFRCCVERIYTVTMSRVINHET